MYAVIFEVQPKPEKYDAYLNIAANLLPELEKIEGFISIERFKSLSNEKKLLSLSFWKSEAALIEWRNHVGHQLAQKAGRNTIFEDYRLRVVDVVRDYGMFERDEAPQK